MVARSLLAAAATGSAVLVNAAVYPKVKSSTLFGPVTDPSLVRDSCGSTAWNTNRLLWVCRDTQDMGTDGLPEFPAFSSSASYTNFNKDGSIPWQPIAENDFGYTSELIMYGKNHNKAFYPLTYDECNDNQSGQCGDTSRYALWPNNPPMITDINADGSILAYTWIPKTHILPNLASLDSNPAASLYRVFWQPEAEGPKSSKLPQAELVNETFWGDDVLLYGTSGNIVRNGTCYLYTEARSGGLALAKVPVGGVEDRSQYNFWVNGAWTTEMPNINDTSIGIAATAGGQGTFYYSDTWESYVWIGQQGGTVDPDFYITTAPNPMGPWIAPQHFLHVQTGNFTLGAYSMQAHPGLRANPWTNDIYISYTRNDVIDNKNLYTQPLYHIEWE